MAPGDLDKALCGLPLLHSPNLMVGLEKPDDAGVYKLTDELAIVQTVDFFTPIVDDPHVFGQIAVANALSDVYAMGGKPITAMNVVCFPSKTMDISILRDILKGGLEKMREAGVVLLGGHSIQDEELKYGLSVTGIIHPEKLITDAGAKPGDKLILTKPLGTGIVNTALKRGLADEDTVNRVVKYMVTLNDKAAELMQEVGVNACTDVTGFGLLGHACEIAENSGVGMKIEAGSLPIIAGAIEFAKMGLVPGGTERNKEFRCDTIDLPGDLPDYMHDILFDPQTSGGLLISVSAAKAELLLDRLREAGMAESTVIGEVVEKPQPRITIE